MGFQDNLMLALRALKGNTLRSILTLSIIAIGIMSLIMILTSIEAIKSKLTDDFVELGAGAFTVQRTDGLENWKNRSANPNITIEQAEEFKERFNFPSTVSFYAEMNGNAIVKSNFKESNPNVSVGAADFDYVQVTGKSIYMGRNFSQLEVEQGSNVAVIGYDLAGRLYPAVDSVIGSYLSIEGKKFLVIGLIKAKGASAGSNDNYMLIPYRTAMKDFSTKSRSFDIIVEADDTEQLDWATEEAAGIFRSIRKLDIAQEDDFHIARSDKLSEMYLEQMSMVTIVSIIISLLTLIGAGVGLMNIMLVSVNERTREIGISKSLGATKAVIFKQFLFEAITICVLGGVIGVLLGIILGNIFSIFVIKSGFVFATGWVLFGLAFCTFIGLLAGLYPAAKASVLNPIEALRYE